MRVVVVLEEYQQVVRELVVVKLVEMVKEIQIQGGLYIFLQD